MKLHADMYANYIKTISSMAPSMATLKLLSELCLPKSNVLDLGTGLSSLILRLENDLTVWSIDDNLDWLNRTRNYCNDLGVGHKGVFMTWNELMYEINERPPVFDVVFVDIGTTPNRPRYLPQILERLCTPKSLVLFDDMHKPTIRGAIEEALSRYDYIDIDVKERTMDQYRRYCKLVFRLREKERING